MTIKVDKEKNVDTQYRNAGKGIEKPAKRKYTRRAVTIEAVADNVEELTQAEIDEVLETLVPDAPAVARVVTDQPATIRKSKKADITFDEAIAQAPTLTEADIVFDVKELEKVPSPPVDSTKLIKADLSHYVKTKSARGNPSFDCDDETASMLRGLTLNAVYELVGDELREKYQHLNPGMQRMNLANRLRKSLRNAEKVQG